MKCLNYLIDNTGDAEDNYKALKALKKLKQKRSGKPYIKLTHPDYPNTFIEVEKCKYHNRRCFYFDYEIIGEGIW